MRPNYLLAAWNPSPHRLSASASPVHSWSAAARQILVAGFALVALSACDRAQTEPKPTATRLSPPPASPQPATAPKLLSRPQDSAPAEVEQALSSLPVYELRMKAPELSGLERSAFSNEPVPATFIADGVVYEGVRVRYRGAWARSWPKKPMKIFFPDEKRFQGQRCLNLNSGWHDPALVRECLAFHVYKACGTPAPKARMVRLNMNGQFRGVYVQVEQPDQGFVKELELKGASVYKAVSRANMSDERDLGPEAVYRGHYEKQTRKQEGYADLQQFCHELAQTQDVLEFFNRRVDVPKYINYLAAGVLTQNWDAYNKNHFLIYDGQGSHKWFPVPWDLDRTFGDHWHWNFDEAHLSPMLGTRQMPGVTGWNRMADRFLSNPVLRKQFLDRLAELLDQEFTPEKLFPILDQLERQLGSDAALDRRRWPGADPNVHAGIEQVRHYIKERRAYLQAQVAQLRSRS